MMFGFGIPILFPLAALALTILYVLENALLHYSYRKPPMYDDELNKSVLNTLLIAPLFFLAFGYWIVSSNQLLKNDNLTPVALNSDIPITNHHYNYPLS